ncbi:MAG: hypothetical protein DCC65_09420 [Planctomycetota bacterium]|nr:MAG: hypothetical protein DCC65_09420 [Planctomycetota bacterium]
MAWIGLAGPTPGQPAPKIAESATTAPSAPTCEDELATLDAANNPRDKAIAEFLVARCQLVLDCARPLSLVLADHAAARDQLARETSAVLAQIRVAQESLPGSGLEPEKIATLESELAMHRAFAEAFAAIARDPATDEARKQLTEATIGLALYLDDTRKEVVEAARLWQGVAYRLAAKPDRALQVLRPVLSAPAARRIGFWARIERCRSLADQGRYAAALALAARLGPRVDAWFEDEDTATRKAATDSLRWLKADLLERWAARLQDSGEKERAEQALEERKLILDSEEVPVATDRWLTLDEAVPGILIRRESTEPSDAAPHEDE